MNQKKKGSKFRAIDLLIILLCLTASAASGMAFWRQYTRTLTKLNEEPIGSIIYKKRTAQRKFNDRVVWDSLKQASHLYNGDTIRTVDFSEAIIIFEHDETQLTMNENTMVQIFYNEAEGARIDFGSGKMEIVSGYSAIVIKNGESEIVIEGLVTLNKSEEGFSLSVLEGEAAIDGEQIKTGAIFALDEKGSRNVKPAIAVTSFGSSARILSSYGETTPVVFSWNDSNFGEDTLVIIEVALDANFRQIAASSQVKNENSASVSVENGNYFWRAYPAGANREPANTMYPSGTLEVIPAAGVDLLNPAQQTQFEDESPSFSWTSVREAAAYLLEISANADMRDPVVSRRVEGTRVSQTGLEDGEWYWRVTPVLPNWVSGSVSPSSVNGFTLATSRTTQRAEDTAIAAQLQTQSEPEQGAPQATQPERTEPAEGAGTAKQTEQQPAAAAQTQGARQPSTPQQPLASATLSGNKYEVIDQSMTWDEAKLEAERRGGHLATITSAAEQRFVQNLIANGSKNFYWLGGQRIGNQWSWLTEEPFEYRNFAQGQPDNFAGRQNKLMIMRAINLTIARVSIGQWDDSTNDGLLPNDVYFTADKSGFIIEYPASE